MAITKSSFGITSDGEEAFLYRLENTSGAYVTLPASVAVLSASAYRTERANYVMSALAMTHLQNMKRTPQALVP